MRPTLLLVLALTFAVPVRTQDRPLPPMPEKVLDWKAAALYADSYITDGETIRLIRHDGITVAVFGYTDGDRVVAEVTVGNDSDKRVTVMPEDFFLTYWDKKDKFGYVYSLPPEKIAKKLQSRAKWGNFFRSLAAGMSQTTTETREQGTFNVYGSGGSASGVYSGASTTTGPNIAAQRAAAERNREATAGADAKAERVMDAALKANTVFPKSYVSGLVHFPRKKAQLSVLYLIIDGTAYTFAFGPMKK